MAGLRFGLALTHPVIARELAKGKLPYNVNLVTLTAAAAVLRHRELLAARTTEIIETRQRFAQRVKRIAGLTLYPSAANFVLIRCERVTAQEVFRRLLEEDGILVRDVSASPDLADCLRISVGTPDDMEAAAAALERLLG
jgi:histidinol-phosphate aminotransferase